MMKTERVSITRAKQRLGELVKRAAYGGERIVLDFRDKPQAAIVSIEDLRKLEDQSPSIEDGLAALRELDEIRERIRRRVGTLPDSSEDIARMREERDAELQGLR